MLIQRLWTSPLPECSESLVLSEVAIRTDESQIFRESSCNDHAVEGIRMVQRHRQHAFGVKMVECNVLQGEILDQPVQICGTQGYLSALHLYGDFGKRDRADETFRVRIVEDSTHAWRNRGSPLHSDHEQYLCVEENAQSLYVALEPFVKVVLWLRPIRIQHKIRVLAESAPLRIARSLVESCELSNRLAMTFDDDGLSRFHLSQELGKLIFCFGCADRHFYILAMLLARIQIARA